ncbi:MAG: sugar phosphate isomerase/epimerase [Firmicutes bacterium]|nr:sugar phosphate isomerase/epimerase [Bacillota bacterium]
MKLGFITSILETYTYEQMMDFAAAEGFQYVEVASWPHGKGERRYAGTCHVDAERALEDDEYAEHLLAVSREKGVEISSLAFYPNTLDADPDKRKANVDHLMAVIGASAKLGVGLVTTFIGRDQTKSVENNLEIVKEVWPPILEHAKELGVKVAIENCPMLFDNDQWPGGQNLMTSPANWRKVFSVLPYDNLGINYDPSHFVWQQMDYIRPIYEFKDRIFHVHYKDIKVDKEALKDCGTMAYPLEYMEPKLPGLGDVNWGKYVSALTDIRYKGYTCIEIEDRAFEDTEEDVLNSIRLAKKYLRNFVI